MLNDSSCPVCGTKWSKFLQVERLGCTYCYTTFRDELRPLLERFHHAASQPVFPETESLHLAAALARRAKFERELQDALAREDYAEAGRLRDALRGDNQG